MLLKRIACLAVISCLLLLFITSCSKNGVAGPHTPEYEDDTTKPVMVVNTPLAAEVFRSGDTILINGSVSDNSFHELKVRIVKDADNTEMFSYLVTTHGVENPYRFNIKWKSFASVATNATIFIHGEDHAANAVSRSIPIRINP
jgi:hypothetical protein